MLCVSKWSGPRVCCELWPRLAKLEHCNYRLSGNYPCCATLNVTEPGKAPPAANVLFKVRDQCFAFIFNLWYVLFLYISRQLLFYWHVCVTLNDSKYLKRRKQMSCKFKWIENLIDTLMCLCVHLQSGEIIRFGRFLL